MDRKTLKRSGGHAKEARKAEGSVRDEQGRQKEYSECEERGAGSTRRSPREGEERGRDERGHAEEGRPEEEKGEEERVRKRVEKKERRLSKKIKKEHWRVRLEQERKAKGELQKKYDELAQRQKDFEQHQRQRKGKDEGQEPCEVRDEETKDGPNPQVKEDKKEGGFQQKEIMSDYPCDIDEEDFLELIERPLNQAKEEEREEPEICFKAGEEDRREAAEEVEL